MGNDTYHELSRRSLKVAKNEGVCISQNNSYVTVRTYKGINIFDFSYNLNCTDKRIDCIESSLIIPKISPTFHLYDGPLLKNELKNAQVTDMILNSLFWPHNLQLMDEMTYISAIQWSPRHFFHVEGLLAVMNSIGGIVFATQEDFKWMYVLDLSTYVIKNIDHIKLPNKFKELKQSVYALSTTAFCWAKHINPDKSCYFVTAQKNGAILIWSIENDLSQVNLVTTIKSDTHDIENIIWIPMTGEKFGLVYSDVGGQIFAYVCDICNSNIVVLSSNVLWKYKDKMIASNFQYIIENDDVILVCSKNRHLVALSINDSCKVVSQFIHNVNDYRITAVVDSLNGLYLSTVNMNIYKLHVSYTNCSLNIVCKPIEMKDAYPNHEIYSLSFSNTDMFLTMAVVDRKVLCRKENLSVEIIFMSTQEKLESVVPTLFTLDSLTDHFDCIEGLRYMCLKQSYLPSLDYNELYAAANTDLHKMRIYLIILIIYINFQRNLLRHSIDVPQKSVKVVRDKIMLQHAVKLLKQFYDKSQSNINLSEFETESFVGAKRYLEYYAHQHKVEVSKLVDPIVLNVVDSNFKYECQSCEGLIRDGAFSCPSGHLNMFCMQSFTPITSDDYLFCKCCNYMARSECGKDALCLFCDLYLVRLHNYD